MLRYRSTPRTAQEIGQELGVGVVVVSTVRSAEDTIDLNFQLIYAESDAILWGDTYITAFSAEEFFEVQSEMALSVAAALDEKLSEDELMRLSDVPIEGSSADPRLDLLRSHQGFAQLIEKYESK
jgi:hypothetical protein